jgi:predicted phage baseplate assembly protein
MLPDLLDSGSNDLDCVVEVDDEGLANLRFGDDDLGKAPDAQSKFTAEYRVGIGKAGMIAADSLRHIVFRNGFADGLTARNPLAAAGAIEPEPIAEIKQFAPFTFRNQMRRAITPEDYASLAQAPNEPRVQRAEARFLWTGSWYEVSVAIDPVADVPEKDYTALAKEVERHLYKYRRIGHDVQVQIARSVPIDLVLDICVMPDYLRGHVEAALKDAFGNRKLADGRTGFFYPDNMVVGEGVPVSRIVATAQAVPGVYSVHVKKLNRKFEHLGHAFETGILTVAPWELPRLDNDPSFPEHGTLKLNLRGGR